MRPLRPAPEVELPDDIDQFHVPNPEDSAWNEEDVLAGVPSFCTNCDNETTDGSDMCPVCQENPAGTDPHRYEESFSFDKFMDNILIKESAAPKIRTAADSLQRIRAARRQDRPLNKVRFR